MIGDLEALARERSGIIREIFAREVGFYTSSRRRGGGRAPLDLVRVGFSSRLARARRIRARMTGL